MHRILLWMALAVAPFWESKPAADWTEQQLHVLLTDSPWAQAVERGGPVAFLATAQPIQDAEREIWRRRTAKGGVGPDPEYGAFLEKDHGEHIVLAIAYRDPRPLADANEARRMEEESVLQVGKKKYKITGQFPPTPSDPYLRLVYPRKVTPADKSLVFDLYLPGVSGYHTVEFRLKELLYRGKPEL
jgi:hypothetical protein